MPVEGYLIDRSARRSWSAGRRRAGRHRLGDQLLRRLAALLYVAAAIGGIGAGVVYGACVGNALKWFPDRRGLAAGLTAAGFGAGSALTIIPIANMIQSSGYQTAFLWFGLGQGIVVVRVGCCCARRSRARCPRRLRRRCSRRAATTRRHEVLQDAGLLGDVRDVRAWSAPAA